MTSFGRALAIACSILRLVKLACVLRVSRVKISSPQCMNAELISAPTGFAVFGAFVAPSLIEDESHFISILFGLKSENEGEAGSELREKRWVLCGAKAYKSHVALSIGVLVHLVIKHFFLYFAIPLPVPYFST
jgi:hypothetical protein